MAATIDTGEFRRRCDNVGGVVQFSEDNPLMSCVAIATTFPPPPLTVYFDEFTASEQLEAEELVNLDDDEQQRLAVYFSLVYNGTPFSQWNMMSFLDLRELYLSLDMYYIFPDDIMPRTPILRNRPQGEPPFYRVPEDVVMRQRYLYDLSDATPNNGYIELIHFGPLNVEVPDPDPELYTGTYYYKATGSGVSMNVGNKTLIAWNKVHALRILGVGNETIYDQAGVGFRDGVVAAQAALGLDFDQALTFVINEMVNGKSLRYDPQSGRYVYFGLGDAGDVYLATEATNQGYSSIQMVRESQSAPNAPIAAVGYEFIDLRQPVESSNNLLVDLKVPIS